VGYTGITRQRGRIGLKSASKRDIAEINAGLKTINDLLKERGKEPKPWGNLYKPEGVECVEGLTKIPEPTDKDSGGKMK
jgi:hypothetical protein